MSVMWVAGRNDKDNKKGSRLPTLNLKISEKKFQTTFTMEDGKMDSRMAKSKMKLNKFYKWKFTQTKDSAGKVGVLSKVTGVG